MEASVLTNLIFEQEVFSPQLALEVFAYQYAHNPVYRGWCDALKVRPQEVTSLEKIPFLPIRFFKTHQVICGDFTPELIFESSGTTGTINSRHLVKEAALYQRSFQQAFENFYGPVTDYCLLGLLPNYLEKGNSSLIKMTHDLIQLSGHPDSGFYLYDFDRLAELIWTLEGKGQKTLLLGVTFALMDFADRFEQLKEMNNRPALLQNTIIMDTGGMKGRKKESTREQVHTYIAARLGVSEIHSEYGMTELLSQAYSKGEGRYFCPPWMQAILRDETDPFALQLQGKGLLNIIDLANIHSCSFIATDDVGWIHKDYFEVWGRLDHSDLRGCSLLVAQ